MMYSPSPESKSPWWQRGRIHVPGFDVLTIFCLVLIIIHSLIEFSGGVEAYEALYTQQLGLSVDGIKEGKLWQLLSHALLHGNWFHLITNLLILWIMGGRLLHIIGQKKVALTMLLSSLGGGVFFVVFDAFSGISRPLVGASGIALGLFTLMAMLAPCARVRPLPISARNMAYGFLIVSLAFCLLNLSLWSQGIASADSYKVAHACHLGGGLVGLYMSTRVMGKIITLEQLRKTRIN